MSKKTQQSKQKRGLAIEVKTPLEYFDVISICESNSRTFHNSASTANQELTYNMGNKCIIFDNGKKTNFMHSWENYKFPKTWISYEEFIEEYIK